MPLKHLRVCPLCDSVRFAACSLVCHVPDGEQKDSWLPNIQQGAGEFPMKESA